MMRYTVRISTLHGHAAGFCPARSAQPASHAMAQQKGSKTRGPPRAPPLLHQAEASAADGQAENVVLRLRFADRQLIKPERPPT